MVPQGWCRRPPVIGWMVVAATLGVLPWASASQESERSSEPRQFGGEYAALSDQQKALVDDLFARFTRITGHEVDPEEGFNRARLSVRTTFDAVTHALTTSRLTDAQTGEALGTALDLIDHLESVHGKVKGEGGDRQFRLYVALKPDALDKLGRSEEFVRKGDNTIFHKGYPLNYRQEGVPSMQISMSRDGRRADIDVDYRSERFPASLINGHLTAANSDVRAGNFGRHTQRWDGLVNWWDGFFGRLFAGDSYEGEEGREEEFPLQPRAGKTTIDVAVADFLTSWLVDGQPNLAVAYVDPEAYDCLAVRLEEEGKQLDRGLAKFQMYMRMKAVGDELGPRTSLRETIIGVRVFNPNFKLVRHDRHSEFVLHGIPRYLAERMRCGNYTRIGALPQERQLRLDDGRIEYFLSTFYVRGTRGRGMAVGLLWKKKGGYWKIISHESEVDAEGEDPAMPNIAEPIETAAMGTMPGDPTLVAANDDFLDAWLKEKSFDKVMTYFSPRSYACATLLGGPDDASLKTPEAQRARIRVGLERTGAGVGSIARLEDAIEAAEPWDPRVRLVEHPRSAAYSLLGLPGWAGQQAECRRMVERGGGPAVEAADKSYGRYFASAFHFTTYAGEPAVLYLGWEKEQDDWRIFAFRVVEP
jgi:hypothetical protein